MNCPWMFRKTILIHCLFVLIHRVTYVSSTLLFGRYIFNWFTKPMSHSMEWDNYHRLDTIHDWMDEMANTYPDMVKVRTIGHSVEGRKLKLAKVGTSGLKRSDGRNKSAIFIEGGIHAREWISPATVTYLMNQLITNAEYRDLVRQYDFFILPVTNPDGYEYSHTTDRLWRKNRARNRETFGLCRGVDLNRNFGFKWADGINIFDPRPASPLHCIDTYHGPKAFSEPETKALRDFVMARRERITMYLAFHSFGNKILYPWGHTSEHVSDWKDLQDLANVAGSAIRRSTGGSLHMKVGQMARRNWDEPPNNGSSRLFTEGDGEFASGTNHVYEIGQAPETLYRVVGASDDWAKGSVGIKWVLLFELPGGVYGFLLPSRYIHRVGSSITAAVNAMVNAVDTGKVSNRDANMDPERNNSKYLDLDNAISDKNEVNGNIKMRAP